MRMRRQIVWNSCDMKSSHFIFCLIIFYLLFVESYEPDRTKVTVEFESDDSEVGVKISEVGEIPSEVGGKTSEVMVIPAGVKVKTSEMKGKPRK